MFKNSFGLALICLAIQAIALAPQVASASGAETPIILANVAAPEPEPTPMTEPPADPAQAAPAAPAPTDTPAADVPPAVEAPAATGGTNMPVIIGGIAVLVMAAGVGIWLSSRNKN